MKTIKRIILSIIVIIALALYAVYFLYTPSADKFPDKTSINGIDVSGLSLKQAEKKMAEDWNSKSFSFNYKGETGEVPMKDLTFDIPIEPILKSPDLYHKFRILLGRENSYKVQMWPDKSEEFLVQIADLPMCSTEGKIPTKDAYVDLSDFEFRIVKEKIGTEVDPHVVMNIARCKIADGEFFAELTDKQVIRQPKITADSEQIAKRQKYCKDNLSFKVEYDIGGEPEVIKPAILDEMVTYTSKGPEFDDQRIEAYVKDLAGRFNEYGETYSFTASSGNVIQVQGVTFGKFLDQEGMVSDLKEVLEAQEPADLEVKWAQTKYNDTAGIGNSYIEVSIEDQHVWCYKDGECVVECDCVTGAPGHDTARGVFTIQYVTGPTVLRGDNGDGSRYESPVNCFMPFYNGQGLHGSNGWRVRWGGEIYKTNGSHGCVNCPDNAARAMADIVSSGYPVVIY